MRMTVRAMIAFAAIFVAACMPTAPLTEKTSALPQRPLRVVARHDVMEVGPILVALESAGPQRLVFATGGVENLFKPVVAGNARDRRDFVDSTADIAANAETQGLRVSLANPEFRIILTVSEGLYRIVGRRSAGISTVADLRGKRIGINPRTSADYFLELMLNKAGVKREEVTTVSLRPREMAAGIREGRVDAISMWEPEAEQAMVDLGEDAVSFSDPMLYREVYNLNTTATALADPVRRKQIVDFVRQVIAGAKVAREDSARVIDLYAKSSGYPRDLVAASWPHHRFPAILVADLLDVLEEEEKWLAALDKRTPRARGELAKLIDTSVLKEALAK
jgi:sulfonate transport system substrate-binding protein